MRIGERLLTYVYVGGVEWKYVRHYRPSLGVSCFILLVCVFPTMVCEMRSLCRRVYTRRSDMEDLQRATSNDAGRLDSAQWNRFTFLTSATMQDYHPDLKLFEALFVRSVVNQTMRSG